MSWLRVLPLAGLMLPTTGLAQDKFSAALNPLAALDKATLKGFVDMPLFETSRRPPTVVAPLASLPPPPAPKVIEPPPLLQLMGIVEGSRSLAAIVHRDDTGRTETLRSGDRIGAWTIQVLPTAVRVVSGERTFDYALFRKNHQQGPTVVARDQAGSISH